MQVCIAENLFKSENISRTTKEVTKRKNYQEYEAENARQRAVNICQKSLKLKHKA